MPARKPTAPATLDEALAALEQRATPRVKDGLSRFGIVTEARVLGIPVGDLRALAKTLGRSHSLAAGLWETGWYESRMLACFVDDPAEVTAAQMDAWCRDFDNWALCDTACFHLFDRTPHAFRKVTQWSTRRAEFEKRAAYALLASVAGHDKKATDDAFLPCLPLIEAAASDERNFVKKAVSWALRGVGQRSPALHAASVELAGRLATSKNATERWVGKDALKDLQRPLVTQRIAQKAKAR